jgi:hypothetical protein
MAGIGVVHALVPEANHCGNSCETYVAVIGPMCRDQANEMEWKRYKSKALESLKKKKLVGGRILLS